MIRIRKKKEVHEEDSQEVLHEDKPIPDDSAYVGAYPGKPWEKLTKTRPGKGSRLKVLSNEEQKQIIEIAGKYFGFKGGNFAEARLMIQKELDKGESNIAELFFARAFFPEKRLAIRAYLSNAAGRHISHERSLKLLEYFAEAGLDFEVGAVDYYIEDKIKTELLIGDGTEVVSENGYWFSHTHPAKAGVTSNFLPSTQDLDIMILTARAYAQHLEKYESEYYVFRDIGMTKVQIATSLKQRPGQAQVESVKIKYLSNVKENEDIKSQLSKLKFHLRTIHNIADKKIEINKLK